MYITKINFRQRSVESAHYHLWNSGNSVKTLSWYVRLWHSLWFHQK